MYDSSDLFIITWIINNMGYKLQKHHLINTCKYIIPLIHVSYQTKKPMRACSLTPPYLVVLCKDSW